MSEFTITCHADEQINMELRQDPAFYVWNANAHESVATVALTGTDREVVIYCDGEMRVHLWDTPKKQGDHNVIRYCDDLMSDEGIDTDSKLASADERMEWINNAWFDLYATDHNVGEQGWLNCVTYSIKDAIDSAKTVLIDDELWKDQDTNEGKQ